MATTDHGITEPRGVPSQHPVDQECSRCLSIEAIGGRGARPQLEYRDREVMQVLQTCMWNSILVRAGPPKGGRGRTSKKGMAPWHLAAIAADNGVQATASAREIKAGLPG
jgi:hypothetical protein